MSAFGRNSTMRIFSIMILAIFAVGLASATPLSDFLSDNATDITVRMTQTDTVNQFYIDTSGQSWDETEFGALSEILAGINLRVDLVDGATSPIFSQVSISDMGFLANGLLNSLGYDVFSTNATHNTELLNSLAENSLPVPMVGNAYFIKNGNNYEGGYDEGFGSIPSEYKNQINEAIVRGVNSLNLGDLLEENVLPLADFDEILPILQDLGYNVTEVQYNESVALVLDNVQYNISVNLESVSFQDGTYEIPVIITPLTGDTTPITKTVTLVLEGIVNGVDGDVVTGSEYVPSDPGVKEVISKITGLPNGAVIAIQTSDVPVLGVSGLSNTNALKYLIITIPGYTDGAQITFEVPVSEIADPNKISLYVWEESNNPPSWVQLSTTFIGTAVNGDYQFVATTPHFSTFMIGEDTFVPVSGAAGGNSGSRGSSSANTLDRTDAEVLSTDSETPDNESPEIELTDDKKGFFATLTGAVIGALGTGGSILVVVFLMGVIGSLVALGVKNRRLNAVKSKKE